MFFWDRRSRFWIIIRLIMGHYDVIFWDRRSWYWYITRWIMGQNKVNFLGYWKVILVHIWRWPHGTFQDDNNIFHKMKNDLTTGTWQVDIWCPINIILLCTSDALWFILFWLLWSDHTPPLRWVWQAIIPSCPTVTLVLCHIVEMSCYHSLWAVKSWILPAYWYSGLYDHH